MKASFEPVRRPPDELDYVPDEAMEEQKEPVPELMHMTSEELRQQQAIYDNLKRKQQRPVCSVCKKDIHGGEE